MYYYIVNPAAGEGAINTIQDRLKSTLLRLKIDGEFAKTIGEGDAAKIASKAIAQGTKTIVAVGGDATVNEIVTAVHKARARHVAIGIIPIGKRNTLADHLGISDWQQACKVLSLRRLQPYSLLKSGDSVFIYNADIQPATPKSQPNKPRTDFSYLLDVNGGFRIRGTASRIRVYNQKFLQAELGNKLLVHISPALNKPKQRPRWRSFLDKLSGSRSTQPAYSQLHAARVTLQAQTAASMSIDGRPLEGKRWEISLSEDQVQFITGKKP